jgi:hypothetical protein
MNNNLNPDIQNNLINRDSSHTAQISTSSKSVGGRRRKYKSIKYKKSKLRRKYKSRRHKKSRKSKKQRRSRKQRGGSNIIYPTYRTYSTSLEPGVNGMYANGPSVGKIIEQFN